MSKIMAKLESWSRIPFWPLLAKCVLVLALFCPVLFAVLYPARKAEADAYAQAPTCAAGVTDSSRCRLMMDAEVVNADCRYSFRPQPDDFCELELRVIGLQRFVAFDRERIQRLSAGTRLRVEIFQSKPTGAEFDGRFVRERGSPEEAVHMLKIVLVIWTMLGVAAGVYLWRRKKIEK